MSNRKGVSALIREFLLRIIRFQGGMYVNCEGGIGSDNPHLLRLIEDGLVKLVRSGGKTVLGTPKGTPRIVRRTRAVSVERVTVPNVICPSCGELCSDPMPTVSTWRWVREKHKFDCVIRVDHWIDRYNRPDEIRNAARGRTGGQRTVQTRFETRKSKRISKKYNKRLAARQAKVKNAQS